MSTHKIDIIEIGDVLPHPDPEVERMQLTHVMGWQTCIRKGQFNKGDKAVWIEPDFEVPLSHPSFAFLKTDKNLGKTFERIKVRKFRGQISQGLLIDVPDDLKHFPVGSNIIEQMGIQRYEPPLPTSTYGGFTKPPKLNYMPKFDVESYNRYGHVFKDGEDVVITEKIHGASSKYTMANDYDNNLIQFCGSRTNWMQDDETNIWWIAFRQNPSISEWCKNNPETILYGEVFGNVQSLKYGANKNQIFFAAFGILDKSRWLDWDEFQKSTQEYNVPTVPLICRGTFNETQARGFAEQDSRWPGANHMSEGVVILPVKERQDPEIGRVQLKIVSNRYLEKN